MENKILTDNKELIQSVTDEVMRRVLQLLKDENIKKSNCDHKVFFLKPREQYKERKAEELIDKICLQKFNVVTSCENIDLNCEQCGHCKEAVEQCQNLVVYGLSNKELANISLGIISDCREMYISHAILKGKRIYVINEGVEYKDYKNTCNHNFYNMYGTYEKVLQSFGVDFVNESNLLSEIGKKRTEDKKVIEEEAKEENNIYDLTDKKVICEGELKKASYSGIKSVSIDAKAIFTPLAMDFVRRNKISLLRKL
ncbi:hypothetical protein [Hathewaya proteolytica]|uniref:hypothetical protein n=1 Tax=Hathewaya proteolytica TaxID=29365 RepID=UPI001160722C|nr:hypothetical protein [Hathewaya proteolytica]